MSIRAGKSIDVCKEEYECISFIIFEKIMPEMEIGDSPIMKFKDDIIYLL